MYPQQSFLTQDSSDFERSLLTFSDGCKLDSSGEEYAAQAVAEAFIGSKVSYADRSRWTRDNKELIQAIAENPLAHIPQWEEVDKPWQFIQLANEWNRVVLQGSKPLWNVPIGADATSSGLQLLSAMRRDPVGMEFSNLFAPTSKNDPPRDAYTRVLEIAKERVLNHKDKAWLAEYLNDRKLGKIILMKKVYGAVWSTNEREVREYFRDKKVFPKTIDHECTKYLTDVLRDASEEVFPMAFAALDWIQNLYSTAQKKKPSPDSYTWTTPNLDSIDLKKADLKVKRIETSCYGRTTIPLTEIKEPAYRRMKSSIAPDFIHSYDSCVLKSAFQNWNKSLVVIHDCFKVLPNDMDLAKDRIRHGFVHVCSGDPLARLADDLGVTEEELPRLKQGNARLEDVLNSSYMFN
jgi:DNA-directed RNA polymerase